MTDSTRYCDALDARARTDSVDPAAPGRAALGRAHPDERASAGQPAPVERGFAGVARLELGEPLVQLIDQATIMVRLP